MTKDAVRAAISSYKKQRITGRHLVQSAVLVPLVCKDGELQVLLTERTMGVGLHKGEVCLPGGAVHAEDDSLRDTALREAWEETGLSPGDVEIIGEIDDNVVQSTGYVITPFVGLAPYPYPFTANESEISDLFFVPLRVLMDAQEFRHQERVIGAYYYSGPVLDYDGHVIWGATGRILKHLVALLSGGGVSTHA